MVLKWTVHGQRINIAGANNGRNVRKQEHGLY